MIFGLATMFAATVSGCTSVAGADRLWLPPTRWVIVGEMHGTNETPEAFVNLICLAAASGRPVTVALEYSANWQPVIDAWLDSDGNADARAALLKLPVWLPKMQDGRGSVAFLQMLERLRQMKRAGRITGVICSDVGSATPAGQARDAAMAQAWQAIPAAGNAIILALVGKVHAMRHPLVRPDQTIVTAASLMPSAQTITVNAVGDGGKAWNCQADGCGEHENGVTHQSAAGISYASADDDRWSATYHLGRPTTAATPELGDSKAR